jgi:hypothetical protein
MNCGKMAANSSMALGLLMPSRNSCVARLRRERGGTWLSSAARWPASWLCQAFQPSQKR